MNRSRAATALLRMIPGAAALVAVVSLHVPASVVAQQAETLPGSEISLSGRTNLGAWRCMVGGAVIEAGAGADALRDARAALPIVSIDCGSRAMESDLRAALRADSHPRIEIRSVRVVGLRDGSADVAATIEVAGVARAIETTVRWQLEGDRIRLSGALPLRMTEFGVTPPRAMLGLVRVRDEVVVRYTVILAWPRARAFAGPLPEPLPEGRP